MKRPSYSIYRLPSAMKGSCMMLRDRLHVLLITMVETLPGVQKYALYAPALTYFDGKREQQTRYTVAILFNDNHKELWATTWSEKPEHDSPLELVRQAHAEALGAGYRLFSEADLCANNVERCNRRTILYSLARWRTFDTASLEVELRKILEHRTEASLDELGTLTGKPGPEVSLAAFRLIVKGLAESDLAHALISPKWHIRRQAHALEKKA